jgi:8-oxo-dGTP pyrophosphatase MutT (NUDIX family)
MTIIINRTDSIYKGKSLELVRETVTLPQGTTSTIDIIRHLGAAAIIPFLDRDTIILLEQYRHAIGDYIWEIPAGTLNADETPLECAKRELTEETGYSSDAWRWLGEIIPVPGYSNERIHIFTAACLVPQEQNPDSDEIFRVHRVSLPDALAMIRNGTIKDGKTICGLAMASHMFDFNLS